MENSLGKLYLLPVSPWAHRVILVQRHARCASVKIYEYRPKLTEFWLRLRGFVPHNAKVTQPLLLPADGSSAIMDSHAISRALVARRSPNVSTLFPPEHDTALRELVQAAETLASYGRAEFSRVLVSDSQFAANTLFPKFLRWLPFIKSIAAAIARDITAKYQPESDAADEYHVRKALDLVDAAVKRANCDLHLLGGTISYADFVVCHSCQFLAPNPAMKFSMPESSDSYAEEYPEIKKWASNFISKFILEEHLKWPLPRYGAN